jgi:hypothetical protein
MYCSLAKAVDCLTVISVCPTGRCLFALATGSKLVGTISNYYLTDHVRDAQLQHA